MSDNENLIALVMRAKICCVQRKPGRDLVEAEKGLW